MISGSACFGWRRRMSASLREPPSARSPSTAGTASPTCDLTFAVAYSAQIADVLDDWTHILVDELDAVQLFDLERIPPPTACSCCRTRSSSTSR